MNIFASVAKLGPTNKPPSKTSSMEVDLNSCKWAKLTPYNLVFHKAYQKECMEIEQLDKEKVSDHQHTLGLFII